MALKVIAKENPALKSIARDILCLTGKPKSGMMWSHR